MDTFFSVLAIVLIILKLLGILTISWWWVLAPIWGPLAVILGVIAAIAIFGND